MAFGCRIRIRRRSLHVYGHNLVCSCEEIYTTGVIQGLLEFNSYC